MTFSALGSVAYVPHAPLEIFFPPGAAHHIDDSALVLGGVTRGDLGWHDLHPSSARHFQRGHLSASQCQKGSRDHQSGAKTYLP
jgi:hypothetical protein